jgi:hypothetical protein
MRLIITVAVITVTFVTVFIVLLPPGGISPEYYQYIYPPQKATVSNSANFDIKNSDADIEPQEINRRLNARNLDFESDLNEVTKEAEDTWDKFENSRYIQDRTYKETFK